MKASKKEFGKRVENNFKENKTRQGWKDVSTITGYKLKSNSIQSDDPETLASELNAFFTRFDKHDFTSQQKQTLDSVMQLDHERIVVEEAEIGRLFKHINVRSAAGPDNISGKLLKLCHESLTPVFTNLFQWSLDTCYVPTLWKTSTIVPVPKKKSPAQMNDYRPVALTPIPMKCLERVALKHLKADTASNQDPLQFAYSKGRNTEDAILTMLHHIYNHLEKPKSYVRILFVDFSSAFNTIQPHLLSGKLLAMNTNPQLIAWLQSFMTQRPQRVKVGDTLSPIMTTNTGAPQGCVLSPALFTTYTADCKTIETSNVQIKFADDTSLTGLITTDESSYRKGVDELIQWCDSNFLDLNVKKTEEMVIDFRSKPNVLTPITIKGEEVRIVDQYKYLGTILDHKLDWSPNVDLCCKKASQRLYFLRKLRQFRVSGTILQLFYRSVIESAVLYNQICYYNAAKVADKERLDKIVRSAEKLIGEPLRPLSESYELSVVKKVVKTLDDSNHPLHETFVAQKSRRNNGRLLSVKAGSDRKFKSFVPTAIRLYNNN